MLKVFAFTIVMVTCIGVTSVGYADTEPPPPPPPSPPLPMSGPTAALAITNSCHSLAGAVQSAMGWVAAMPITNCQRQLSARTNRSQRSASPIANIRRMIVLITEFTQAARIERARGSVRYVRAIQREVLSTAGLHGTMPRQAQATLAKERGPSGLPHSYASRTAAVTRLSSPASSWPTNLPSGPSPAAMGAHRSSKSR